MGIRSRLFHLRFALTRALINWWTKPTIIGSHRLKSHTTYCYVLNTHSITDLAILDQTCRGLNIDAPLAPLALLAPPAPLAPLNQHYFFLHSRKRFFRSLKHLRGNPKQLITLNNYFREPHNETPVALLPISIFWSHAPDKERSLFRLLFSEHWRVTSRMRRILALLLNRKHITVQIGEAISLSSIVQKSLKDALDEERLLRREMRILRVAFKKHRTAFLGPDRSHRRTLLNEIVSSGDVQTAILASDEKKAQRLALKHANTIVSDISTVNVRFLHIALSWFWNRIYDGVEVHGLNQISSIAETASIVYIPAHRSHIDYLLLSYLLYSQGLQLPHVAAGDNLNIPIVGPILRRAGAFFMRRSFRNAPLYSAVFKEYFSQLLIRGYSIKFFLEGGRTRTGRLLPAKAGLLNMTITTVQQNPHKSIVLVPVYIGYEKLIEANSYFKELRGEQKTGESIGDIIQNIRLIRQSFGKVYVNFGEPIYLADFLKRQSLTSKQSLSQALKNSTSENSINASSDAKLHDLSQRLGSEILTRINAASAVNPVNLVAMVSLCTPKLAIDELLLSQQIDVYLDLLSNYNSWRGTFTLPDLNGQECISHVESLGMLKREQHDAGDILYLDDYSGVLFTWYRNNVLHTLALPSLLACLIIERRSLDRKSCLSMAITVFPFLSHELNMPPINEEQIDFWLNLLTQKQLLNQQTPAKSQRSPTTLYSPPAPHSPGYYQLDLLARLVMQTLERFYIVIGLLKQAGSGQLDQEALENKCIKIAERISRLYGLNAPEFFDKRLFQGFLHALLNAAVITENSAGKLEFGELISQVYRSSDRVIRKEFRYAVLRARQ
ncbi:MAG: glycerol-3-phosphate 1-O-acyltransferase PlsB [Pseudomonadales bacterium]|nr:glycerol-3-phosphate 1-O-acyltransferase PlsB [Pseudomonadales bacterium]